MDKTIRPAVITSRRAQGDYQKIQNDHSDILQGMAVQSQKVAAYNQQKQSDLAAENTMKMEMQKEKMNADSMARKDAMNFEQKQAEINIKRAALSMKQ